MDLENIFLTLLNMSLTGSIIIVFVLLARLFLRKAPRVFSYALWAVVLFRLLCPVSVSSVISVLSFTKAAEPVPQSPVTTMNYASVELPEILPLETDREATEAPVRVMPEMDAPQIDVPAISDYRGDVPDGLATEITDAAKKPAREPVWYVTVIWLAGLGVMLAYNAYNCVRLLRQIDGAVHLRKELYLADYIPTAFVLGIGKPRIYLPSYLTPEEQGYIVAHERCHIKRKDHIFRLLGYLALCLHWFNPLVWLAFILSGKDMEMSCDEAVLRMYGPRIRAEYAQSLLRLATGHRSLALMPLAFGEGDTKERVINMSKWKKPKLWATIAALVACVAVLVACAVNPAGETQEPYLDRSKDVDQICTDAIDALMEADSYCILYELEYANDSDSVEYRRHGNDQLILCTENKTNNRIYSEGRLGIYQGEPWSSVEAWVWKSEEPAYDPNEWLREWSLKYLETGNIRMGEKTVTVDVEWPHPVNENRYYKGQILYQFKPGGALEFAQREAVLMEGEKLIRGYVDKITVMEEDAAATQAKIRDTAILCIDSQEYEKQTASQVSEKVLPERKSIPVRTVDEFLAAIGPDTEIVMEAGRFNLSKASGYGQNTGSNYYEWRKVGDGYELLIKNVNNLVISGAGVNATTIETDPRSANVLHLETCYDIFLNGFTTGHTELAGRGECGGGVIKLNQSSNVEMTDLGLFGCGIEGLITEECRNIMLKNSAVYDCSSSAVVLRSTDTAQIIDCNIYNIGAEPWGGYSIFTIERCAGVTVEGCNIADSKTSHFLCAGNNAVTIQNCLVSNNRFEDSVLNVNGWNVTLSQNRFKDNAIRNWYRMGSTEALDEKGKTLTEEVLDEMYGTLPQAPNQPQLQIRVSTVDEFLAAIGPNKEIVLEPGTYNLQTATGYGSAYNDYYFWNDTGVDGFELMIRNVDNMTVRGGGSDRTDVVIEAEPRYANVLNFNACSNITAANFTAGHTKEQGSCTGGVLFFKDCDYVLAEGCGLFGCGTEGVYAETSSSISVQNCDIYECSEGGVEIRNCNTIRLENNTFRNIRGHEYILIISCVDVQVDGEKVIGEKNWGSYEAATTDQVERNSLEATLGNFEGHYWRDEPEELREYLSDSYSGDGSTYGQYNGDFLGIHYDVTFAHVEQIEETGSVTIEIPYRPYKYDDARWKETRYLLVTVVKENGQFKISDYYLKK